MLSYLAIFATITLALLQLAKDWGAHQTHWRRALVLILIIASGVAGSINLHYSNKKAAQQHEYDQRQITALGKAVETANTNQEANTKQFVKSFGDLSQKLTGMQVAVKTAGLQKEAAQLKKELEATQKALVLPKAELLVSLGDLPQATEITKEMALLPNADGTLSFSVSVFNKSGVQARNGSIFLRLCTGCGYVEEPSRFTKPPGAIDADREMIFQAISAVSKITIPLKIKPPDGAHTVDVGATVRCENCSVEDFHRLTLKF